MEMSEYSFWVEGPPKAKARPRVTKKGVTYTPKATLTAEKVIAEAYDGPFFDGPIEVRIEYHQGGQEITIIESELSSKMRGDIDNYVKLTLDGLNGTAWNDDRQVISLRALKC